MYMYCDPIIEYQPIIILFTNSDTITVKLSKFVFKSLLCTCTCTRAAQLHVIVCMYMYMYMYQSCPTNSLYVHQGWGKYFGACA